MYAAGVYINSSNFHLHTFRDINCSVGEEKMSPTYLRVLTRVKLRRENKFINVYYSCNTWKYPKDITQRGGLELWLI